MTRAETKAIASDRLQEVFGSSTTGDPIGLDVACSRVADSLARRKRIWFGFRRVDLVAGQALYELPNTFDLRAVAVGAGLGYTRLNLYAQDWCRRNRRQYEDLAAGSVSFAVDAGDSLYLAPPSSTGETDGLELLGFHNPGVLGSCLWPEETDENPLPVWAHYVCALGLAADRAATRALDPEMRLRVDSLRVEFERESRKLEREAHRQYARVMGGSPKPTPIFR